MFRFIVLLKSYKISAECIQYKKIRNFNLSKPGYEIKIRYSDS